MGLLLGIARARHCSTGSPMVGGKVLALEYLVLSKTCLTVSYWDLLPRGMYQSPPVHCHPQH